MSNVAIFKTGETPRYIKSVNTPDYISDPDVIVNPDISLVSGVPLKYWKRVGNGIDKMLASEQQAIEDAITAEQNQRIENLEQVSPIVLSKALVRAGVITKTNLVANIKEVLNG